MKLFPRSLLSLALLASSSVMAYQLEINGNVYNVAGAPITDVEVTQDKNGVVVKIYPTTINVTYSGGVVVPPPSDTPNSNDSEPVFSGTSSLTAQDGQVAVTPNITATDADTGTGTAAISYTVTGGADQALFNASLPGGTLSFLSAPTYAAGGSNSYEVIVTANDNDTSGAGTATGTTDRTYNVNVAAPIVVGSCPSTPSNVDLVQTSWASQPGQKTINLAGNSRIHSESFTSTGDGTYWGKIAVTTQTGSEAVKRRVWISECPGGPALAQSKCDRTGNSTTVMYWAQFTDKKCILDLNTSYHLNVQNTTCPNSTSGCGVTRTYYSNK